MQTRDDDVSVFPLDHRLGIKSMSTLSHRVWSVHWSQKAVNKRERGTVMSHGTLMQEM